LGQSNETLVRFYLSDTMFRPLMERLAVGVVRPPPMSFGHVDDVQVDTGDFHNRFCLDFWYAVKCPVYFPYGWFWHNLYRST
jgi:hypothetical protein